MSNPSRQRRASVAVALSLVAIFFGASALRVQAALPPGAPTLDGDWPKRVVSGDTTFVLYQPQIDAYVGYAFQAHSAVAVQEPGSESLLYGVISFDARTRVDKGLRLMTLDHVKITKARFPSAEARQDELKGLLQAAVGDVVRSIDLDRVEAGLALLDAQTQGREVPVLNKPPTIIFSNEPAVLVNVDGDPVYRAVEETDYDRILNTRVLILRDSEGGHWLHLMDGFMNAPA